MAACVGIVEHVLRCWCLRLHTGAIQTLQERLLWKLTLGEKSLATSGTRTRFGNLPDFSAGCWAIKWTVPTCVLSAAMHRGAVPDDLQGISAVLDPCVAAARRGQPRTLQPRRHAGRPQERCWYTKKRKWKKDECELWCCCWSLLYSAILRFRADYMSE